MVDRTKQHKLEKEKVEAERNWKQSARKIVSIQNKITKFKEELSTAKEDNKDTFKSFQKVQKEAQVEKMENDKKHFKEKAKERKENKK